MPVTPKGAELALYKKQLLPNTSSKEANSEDRMSLPGLVLLEQKLFRITDIDVRLAAGQGLFTFMLTHRVSYFLGPGSRIHPEGDPFYKWAAYQRGVSEELNWYVIFR